MENEKPEFGKLTTDTYMIRKMGLDLPVNWLMKIAENLSDFRKKKGIISEIEITNPATGIKMLVNALWDTGSTYTCISSKVVEHLSLEEKGHYTLTLPQVISKIPNYDLTVKLDKNKSNHYLLRVGLFNSASDFDVILGLDLLVNGQLTMGVRNGIFYFEFTENVDLK